MSEEPPQSQQRPPDRLRMEPTHPNQPQHLPYQPYQAYQPAQQSSPPRESYTVYDDLWLLEDETTLKISLVVTGIAALLLATVCLVPYLLAAQTADTASRGVATLPTATTLPPQPTNTPLSKPAVAQPLSGVTLGSTRDEITRTLGAPTMRFGTPWYTATLPDGTTVYLGLLVEHTASDGTPHIAGVHIQGPGDTWWSDEQCAAIARVFLLPDGKSVRHSTTSWGAQVNVYMRAHLARTCPASEFKDVVLGDPVAPGTFTTVCPDSAP